MKLPDSEDEFLKKRNRIKKLSLKTHKVSHESGRSTKNLWRHIVDRAKGSRAK